MKRRSAPLFAALALAIARVPAVPSEDLRLSFIGDVMAHNVNYEMKDYDRIYDGIRDLFLADDLTFANLELVVDPSRPRATYPRFNNHPDYVRAAIDAGIDVFSLANNHSFDYGPGGARATLQSMLALARDEAEQGRTVAFNGLRASAAEPFAPTEILLKGWRIGYLAVTQFSNEWVTEPLMPVVDYNDEVQVARLLADVRGWAKQFDLFVVSYHGDNEYVTEPAPAKKRLFHALLAAGAHIVHGHHPHVVQPSELVDVGGERRLIMYSAGNFLTGQSVRAQTADPDGMWARTGDSIVYQVTLRPGNPGPSVGQVEIVPVYHHRSQATGEIVINALETLAHRQGEWGDFYRRRLEIMREYQRANPERERRSLAP
jgi:poly-gamma-glutamate capsule biosynthesis protein CapA/YwtB (metallophosphatase superfamily)